MRKPRICMIPECGKPHHAKGYCGVHYSNHFRHGSPAPKKRISRNLEFVKSAAQSNQDECIMWPYAKTDKGYGLARYKGKVYPAHRLSLFLKTNKNPPDMVAAHKPIVCHKRDCINPRHLRWATFKENSHDRYVDGTMGLGERSHNSKLTARNVIYIRSSNKSCAEMAKLFGVSKTTVRCAMVGKSWRHLPTRQSLLKGGNSDE